jgi:hypothetical protein
MYFSSINNTPITSFLTFGEFKKYYINTFGKDDWKEWYMGNRKIEEVSYAVGYYNLKRAKNEQLTNLQFYEKWCKNGKKISTRVSRKAI